MPEWKPPIYAGAGITVVTSSIRRNTPECLDSKIHHNNLLNNILATIEANVAQVDSAVMLDVHGYISETNDTNLFLVQDGALLTPTAKGRGSKTWRRAGSSSRGPHRTKGHLLHSRDSHHGLLPAVCRLRTRIRRHHGNLDEERRRPNAGQDGDYRIRVSRPIAHAESLEPGSHAWRFQQRFRRGSASVIRRNG